MSNENSDNKLAGGCVALFGLPFLLAGLGIMIFGLSMFYTWVASASWDQVPAQVLAAQIKESRSSKSNTYSLQGKYSYQINGKSYTGTRILIEKGSSSGYSEKEKFLEILNSHKKSGEPIKIFVNPSNPEDAVVFRNLTMMIIVLPFFGSIFAAFGFAMVGGGIFGTIRERRKAAKLAQYPGKPWKAEEIWNNFTISSSSWVAAAGKVALGAFITVFVWIFVLVMGSESDVPFLAKAIIGFFTLLALGFDASAAYSLFQYFKYGNSTLVLSQIPLVPGQEFAGAIVIGKKVTLNKGASLKLRCEKSHTSGSGKNSTTKKTDLFKDIQSVNADLSRGAMNRTVIPFSFKIPDHGLSRNTDTNPSFRWFLNVEIDTPGIDFVAEYDLPVYCVKSLDLVEKKGQDNY